MTGRILPVFSLILPIWLVRTMTTWRGAREVLPALLVAGELIAAMDPSGPIIWTRDWST